MCQLSGAIRVVTRVKITATLCGDLPTRKRRQSINRPKGMAARVICHTDSGWGSREQPTIVERKAICDHMERTLHQEVQIQV